MIRRSGQLAALLALGALAWALAPAFSATPYLPEAVDFSQAVPAVKPIGAAKAASQRPGEGPVSFRSGVIDAPERFDLAGIAGEMRPVELRARDGSGAWSPWTETGDGDPVYFGGADRVQLRTRAFRPAGRLHYVNVSGDATPASGLLSAARGAVSAAVVSAAGLFGETAAAAPAKPHVIGRGAWGANRAKGGCRRRTAPVYGSLKAAVVHHTVTANNYSQAEAPGIVLGICRYHRNANGWNDIGYNALVDRFGNLYVGRSGGLVKAVVGAHSQGFNAQTWGLASIGTHTSKPLGSRAMRAAADLLAWRLVAAGHQANDRAVMRSDGGSQNRWPAGKVIHTKRIIGHRRLGLTECPGNALYRQLAKLRTMTQSAVKAGGGPSGGGGGGVGSP